MAELYANVLNEDDGKITTLNGGINNSTTSITVAGAAPAALQSGQFRIRVDDELMLVTSGQNGTSWTVTRGTEGSSAASHSDGARVRFVITAASLQVAGGGQPLLTSTGTTGNYGTSLTVDFGSTAREKRYRGTFNGNLSVTVQNPVAGSTLVIEGVQDGTGSRTLTVAGQAVTIPSAASAVVSVVVRWYDSSTFQAESAGVESDTAALAALTSHLNDTSDAHDASAISYAGGTGMSATDVEAAIDELANEKADAAVAINAQTGTSYTLVLGDASKLITVSNASTHTLTVPQNSSVAFPVGTVINIARIGAGAVNVAAGSGATVNSPGSALGLRAQYSQATLIKTATNTWLLGGDIA